MKTLEELNLVDDFLVNSLTSHKIYGEQSARYILECILHRQIGKLTVVPQRFFCGENTETHGIRLDVYLDEENGEIFDIEPDQNDGKEEIGNQAQKRYTKLSILSRITKIHILRSVHIRMWPCQKVFAMWPMSLAWYLPP